MVDVRPIVFDDGRGRDVRTVAAPEGVALQMRLAGVTERFAALLLDLLFVGGAFLVLGLILLTMPRTLIESEAVWVLVTLLSFFVRSFYFAWFELKWRGASPGKRALGLRVVDRDGGPLRGDAVLARNLMREVELFLPLSLLLVLGVQAEERWVIWAALLWTGVLALLPVFNRDRLRAGDMVAGTWVIAAPKQALLPDVAAAPARPLLSIATPGEAAADYRFTERQLAIYGAYELQVLEDVLRRSGADSARVFEQVADRIRRKTGWQPADDQPVDARRFLQAFYRAQRARLERDLSFGKRRASKRDRPAGG
ncbi:MAG: RDD family protein [Alphaproteobacteria bacterium]